MELNDKSQSEIIHLDFEQARAKHLLFKSRLRSILYGIEIDNTSVVSHFECAVGKWIYGHALHSYGHIPEMQELEKVHAEIHTSARDLIQLYKNDRVEEARKGLEGMEQIADSLVRLLSLVEIKLKDNASLDLETKEYNPVLDLNLKELYELQKANHELDVRFRAQSSELYKTTERFELVAKATQDAVWDWDLLTNSIWWSFPGTLVDITDRKTTEEALAKSEEQLRNFGNNIQNLAWIANGEGWIFWYNQRWYDYTGTTLDEMQGWGWEKVHHPDHIERVLSFVKEAWTKDEPLELTFPLRRHDGTYRWFLTRAVPIKDKEEKVYQWIGTNTDINDKVEMGEELEKRVLDRTKALQQTNQMLERSNAELEQFAYVTSHDLQEPLRKIQVFNNLLIERHIEELGDSARVYVGKVSESAKRRSGLIKDLLDFSRLSQKTILSEEVDLNIILEDVLKDLEILIQQKEATIKCNRLPLIEGVPLQINQLFYNLINNSLKFIRNEIPPVINISCKKLGKETRARYPGLKGEHEYYILKFEDNGIGFNQKYASKILTIFQRLNNRSSFEGHGIGLAICQKVVINHKGIIFAEGKEEEGASFTVILPTSQS